MEKENVEEMFEKDDHQEKMIFFFKNEADPQLDLDREKPINSQIKFEDPLQISFLIGGEAKIRYGGGNKQEILGILTYAKNQKVWQSLIASITETANAEIRRGCRIDPHFSDYHSFYLNGFKSKEEAIGMIQEKHNSWIQQMERFLESSTPDPIQEGDEQIEDRGIKEGK